MKTCSSCKEEKDLEKFGFAGTFRKSKCMECDRIYKLENPHLQWAEDYRQQALKLKLRMQLDLFTKPLLVEAWSDTCFRCEGSWDRIYYITPIEDGGAHSIENCRPVCEPCSLIREVVVEEPKMPRPRGRKPKQKETKIQTVKETKIPPVKTQAQVPTVFRECSVEGCDRKSQARGYCKSHYKQWYTTGVVKPLHVKGEGCTIEGCERPYEARGLCKNHYAQIRRVETRPAEAPETPLMEKLLSRTEKVGECLLWQGATNGESGSGQVRVNGKRYLTKHAMFLAVHGYESPDPLTTSCNNKTCVNMKHIVKY